ncbi:hypothetical protein SELMODRAFT_101681 [Selaginella moellendorffii]|uniref:Small hydrophilic plant seed protein n=1 Tax=Selaginella moellendorffii TaxID=88036 RepID=D8RU90_SELML|nr:hypothetical protein SELMODRAFT_101681 [Selaginella moellendorffii]
MPIRVAAVYHERERERERESAQQETKKRSDAGAPVDQDASREELKKRSEQGETVIKGGTGGKSLEAQENLAKGRSKGGQSGQT